MMNVYVLSGACGSLYVGMTADLRKRLYSHRMLSCKTTAKLFNGEFILEHVWEIPSFTLASKFERWLHMAGDQQTIDLMLDVPVWCNYLEKLVSKLRTSDFESRAERARDKARSAARAKPLRGSEPRTLYNL